MADGQSLTISKVLGWDLRYLGQVVDMMNETYKFIETEATAAGNAIEQSDDYFDSSAGDAARRRGQEDRTDTIQTSDVIEQMASKLSSLVSTLETNISAIRTRKAEAEDSRWDLFVTEDGHVKSRTSNAETYSDYFPFGDVAVVAKEIVTRRLDNFISAAFTLVQRADQEGAEIYIKEIEKLSDRVQQGLVVKPDDPELAKILEDYQTDVSTGLPRLWPVGWPADILKDNGINVSPSLMTSEEISAMENLLQNQGVDAVAKALTLPDLARNAALAEYPDSVADGQGDAYRHMYWNALMSQQFGEDWAQTYATSHEKTGGNTPQREAMDLYNNEIGRAIGAANPKATPEELAALVGQQIKDGKAVVIQTSNADGSQLPAPQITWSNRVTEAMTGSPAGVGIPLPGSE
ncbi:hypothetical protein [Nocardia sp. NPDC052112]|uniref:DUF6973 domain-containing protein n=1 Tax=Nocardia sp. NPDC052112 TaxID=3155646 RepID=UPI0034270F87